MSLKNILKEMIRQQGKVTTWQLEDIARKQNYKVSNYERRARELVNEGFIRPMRNERKVITAYEYKNNQARQIVFGVDTQESAKQMRILRQEERF